MEKLLEQLVDDKDLEWILIDSSYIKVHIRACGARKGNQAIERSKRRITSKVHFATNKNDMLVRYIVTAGVSVDCAKAEEIISGIDVKGLIADK